MGTVLSISPTSRKGGILDEKTDGASGKTEKNLKRHSVLISALTWKRLVAASAKKKNAKKVNPNPPVSQISNPVDQLNTDNLKKSQSGSERKTKPGPLAVPVPTVPDKSLRSNQTQNASQNGKQLLSVQRQPSSRSIISPRRVIVQASTGELLRCLSEFMCRRCYKLKELSQNEIILWFRNVDRSLLIQGWQDQGFITPANLVFVYLLCREAVTEGISSLIFSSLFFFILFSLFSTRLSSTGSVPGSPTHTHTHSLTLIFSGVEFCNSTLGVWQCPNHNGMK
uniref:Cyclin dependent kinase 5, regulatory subunit 2a (p39) n=1 Tax=Cyprinus carpio carpio TaxID=630221 RepID=A0A8C1B3N8_CYPCA